MKKIIFLLTIIIFSCNSTNRRYPKGKSKFQRELNILFKDASITPLTSEELKKFKGLNFFPINNKYKVTAKLIKTLDSSVINLPTTTGSFSKYKKYGVLYFTIEKKKLQLDIYKNIDGGIYKNDLFLPFLDKTNGKTTYHGGRFIDIISTSEKNGTIEIDFNKAYNPYCAYNNKYSCPITPRNNFLDIEIKAGVMKYDKL